MTEGITRPDYALPEGTNLHGGAYIIGACLGVGVFGITYTAQDVKNTRLVAINEFFPKGCGRSATHLSAGGGWTPPVLNEHVQQFIDEGRILARIKHPGVVAVYDFFEEYGTAYLAMEHLDGRTIEQIAATRGGKLPEARAVALIRQVCEAVSVVHKAGLLHGNIKPDNIMLRADGHVVLIGFGSAWDFIPDTFFSQTQVYTPGYAALELYSRTGRRGPYTDIYSISATLYYLMTGVVPIPATDRITGIRLPSPQEMDVISSRLVNSAVMAGLETDIAARPQTIEDFLTMLYGDAASIPQELSAGQPPPAPTGPTGTAADVINLPTAEAFKADIDASVANAIRKRFSPKLIPAFAALVVLAGAVPTAFIMRQQAAEQDQANAAKANVDPKQALRNHPIDVISSGACLTRDDAGKNVSMVNLGHSITKVYVWAKLRNNLSQMESQDVTVTLQISGPATVTMPSSFSERIDSTEDYHTIVGNFEEPAPGLPPGQYQYALQINGNTVTATGSFTVS